MSRRVRLAALVVLAVYLAVVGWLSLRPLSVLWVSPANVEPFHTIGGELERGPEEAARTIGAGMLRLAPLGVLLPLLGRQLGGGRLLSLSRTVAAGGLVALLIEWLQSFVASRVPDVDAVILNTVGVAVTHLVCYGPLRAATRRLAAARQAARRDERRGGLPPSEAPRHDDPPLTALRRPAPRPRTGQHTRARQPHRQRHDEPTGQDPTHRGTPTARDRAASRGVRGAALSR